MSLTDRQLGVAVKALSIRRENLYRAQQTQSEGSERWKSFNDQIDDVTDALNALEAERELLRKAVA